MKKLNINEKLEVSYCIPLWLRDEQIKQSTRRIKGRLEPSTGVRKDPVAIVCYGPSLKDTWEKIKDFKYVISMSGSHGFLIERGILPTWHIAVDPQPRNTVQLIGKPHKKVEYLISSTCHPDVFDHLEGFNVKLWNVFDANPDAMRLFEPGELFITGGSDVGLRAMTIARVLGFTELHIFGKDGSESEEGNKHAGKHPADPTKMSEVEYPVGSGRMWRTTTSMLECAIQTFHELDQMPDVKAHFYGKGLVQEMAKHYEPKPVAKPMLVYKKPKLYSDGYQELNERLHKSNPSYGVGGGKHAPVVRKLVETLGLKSVLDYGAGKGHLAKELDFPIWEYDPAIPGKSESPRPAELVVCTDVLEHIEPDKLKNVLSDLKRCIKKIGYFTIHTGPAQKTLPDGRNTHLIQEGEDWWSAKLSKYFTVGKIIQKGMELHVVVSPK